jgi:phage/plasmid-like protein (TIGR03299 family)
MSNKLATTPLNWNVRTESLTTESGIILKDHVSLVRDDNNVPLSVVSSTYHPFQNEQLIELLDKVSQQTGVGIHKSGYFGEGQKVYIQLKTGDLSMPNDRIEGFVTGINSFDGSTSLAFGNSTITISCQNTFFAALHELKTKVRHTKNMMIKVDEVAASLDKALVEEKKMFERIKRMSEVRMTPEVKDLVMRSLFSLDSTLDLSKEDAVSTLTRNKIIKYEIDHKTEVTQKGDNLWGLFSGVTKYTTHTATKNDVETKLFGVYAGRERKIFNDLASLVN